jgi:hypothetical protein
MNIRGTKQVLTQYSRGHAHGDYASRTMGKESASSGFIGLVPLSLIAGWCGLPVLCV